MTADQLELINVLMQVPASIVRMSLTAEYVDDTGPHSAVCVYSARDLRVTWNDFLMSQEGYFRDYPQLLGEDAPMIPVIIKLPDMTYRVQLSNLVDVSGDMDKELTTRSGGKTFERREIRQMRRDFLNYVPEGDEYDAVYTLTDEGRAELERLMKEDDE